VSLQERIEKLEPRERRLLGILGLMFGGFVILAGPFALWRYVDGKRSDNQDIRELIDQIYDARASVAEKKAKHDAILARYARPAPQLAAFIEEAAKENGATAGDTQDLPEVPHGKRYTERSTKVKFHKIHMLALAKTLEKIEQSGYPVSVSRLNIRPHAGGEPDSYEVELAISAFDRKPDAPAGASSASAASSAAPDKEKEP
jgi:general secretion pathway protein M